MPGTWRGPGELCSVVSEETVTAVPTLPTLTSPGRTLVVPLSIPERVQQRTWERHQPRMGPMFSAF